MTIPTVRKYEVEAGFWGDRVSWNATLSFLCPHCKAALKTQYQGPEYVDTCAKCKRGFLVSPERLFALIPDGTPQAKGVLPSSPQTPPIVKDYEIATGLWSGPVHIDSTLKFPCPHCKTSVKTKYRSPDYADPCPTCKRKFLISPERLIARISS
jgi:Zn-finger nucleic acid-binding protein